MDVVSCFSEEITYSFFWGGFNVSFKVSIPWSFFCSVCYFVLGVTDFFQTSSNPRLLTFDEVPLS